MFKDYGRSSNFDENIFRAHISYRQLIFLISSLHLIDTVDNDTADGIASVNPHKTSFDDYQMQGASFEKSLSTKRIL